MRLFISSSKTFAAIRIAAFCMLASATGLGMTSGASGEKAGGVLRIAVHVTDTMSDHSHLWLENLKKHQAVTSGEVKLTTLASGGDLTQIDAIADVVAMRKFDAAIVISSVAENGIRFARRVAGRGIPVWSAAALDTDQIQEVVGPNDFEAGYATAKAVFERMGGAGNVVVLSGCAGSMPALAREAGFGQALAEYPDIRVLDEADASWLRVDAFEIMSQWLLRNTAKIEGVVAHNDDMALGALLAMKVAGHPPAPVAGIDGLPEAIAAVDNGEMVLTLQQDARYEAFETMRRILAHFGHPQYAARSTAPGHASEVPWKYIAAAELKEARR